MRKIILFLSLCLLAQPAWAAEPPLITGKPDPAFIGPTIGPVFPPALSLLTLTASLDPAATCPGQNATLRLWVQTSPVYFPSSSPYANVLTLTATAPGMAPLTWYYSNVLPWLGGGLTVTAVVTRPLGEAPWTVNAAAVLSLGGVSLLSCSLCPPTYVSSFSATAQATLSEDCHPGPFLEPIGAYPNPFQDQVQLAFRLSQDAQVSVRAYDVAGEPVQGFELQGHAGKNVARWDGGNGAGGRCASGVYLIHLAAKAGGLTGAYWVQVAIAR